MADDAIDYVEQYKAQIEFERQQDELDWGVPDAPEKRHDDHEDDNRVEVPKTEKQPEFYDVKERAKAIQEAHEQWIYRNGKYYFKREQNKVAFKDKGDKLTTKSNDLFVTRAMVALEASKGARELYAKGTKEFRRQAWRAGAEIGIKVNGYEPSSVEVQAVSNYKVHSAVAKTVAEQKILHPESREKTLQAIDDRQRELELEALQMYDIGSPSQQPTATAPEKHRELHR